MQPVIYPGSLYELGYQQSLIMVSFSFDIGPPKLPLREDFLRTTAIFQQKRGLVRKKCSSSCKKLFHNVHLEKPLKAGSKLTQVCLKSLTHYNELSRVPQIS